MSAACSGRKTMPRSTSCSAVTMQRWARRSPGRNGCWLWWTHCPAPTPTRHCANGCNARWASARRRHSSRRHNCSCSGNGPLSRAHRRHRTHPIARIPASPSRLPRFRRPRPSPAPHLRLRPPQPRTRPLRYRCPHRPPHRRPSRRRCRHSLRCRLWNRPPNNRGNRHDSDIPARPNRPDRPTGADGANDSHTPGRVNTSRSPGLPNDPHRPDRPNVRRHPPLEPESVLRKPLRGARPRPPPGPERRRSQGVPQAGMAKKTRIAIWSASSGSGA